MINIFFFNQNETRTNKIKAETSTKGLITHANTCLEFSPKMAMATAITNSKLFPAAVKVIEDVLSYLAPIALVKKKVIINIKVK